MGLALEVEECCLQIYREKRTDPPSFEHVYERWPHKISVMSHKQTQNRPNIKIEVTGAILMLEGQTVSAESR